VRDQRVRSDHDHLDTNTYLWSSPPVTVTSGKRAGETNHPGGDIICRCYAENVWEDVLDPKDAQKEVIRNTPKPKKPKQPKATLPAEVKKPGQKLVVKAPVKPAATEPVLIAKDFGDYSPEQSKKIKNSNARNELMLHTEKAKSGAEYSRAVHAEDVETEHMEHINNAFEDTLGKHGVKINQIKFVSGEDAMKYGEDGTWGAAYARVQDKHGNFNSDAIVFNKDSLKNAVDVQKKQREAFFAQMTEARGVEKKRILDIKSQGGSDIEIKKAEKRIEQIDSIKRNTISSDQKTEKDIIHATSKHEAYHAIMEKNDLKEKFAAELAKRNVKKSHMAQVSAYSATDQGELFAETGAAIDMGVDIPIRIKKAFLATIG